MNRGFSLVELIVVMAIVAIISTIGTTSFLNFKQSKTLDVEVDTMVAEIRGVMSRARAQQDGEQWWIHFENASGVANDFYLICHGTYTAPGTNCSDEGGTRFSIRTLPSGINFVDPTEGNSKDVVFAKATGLPTASVKVSLTTGGLAPEGIEIDTTGSVNYGAIWDLVAHWKFDETTGLTAVDTAGDNDGTLTNGPTWAAPAECKISGCLSFDGVDDFVSIPDSETLDSVFGESNKVFTLSAWVYPTAWVNYSTILNKASGGSWSNTTVGLWSYATGLRCVIGSNVGGNPAGSYIGVQYQPTLNDWHHVVCVGDGETLKIYVDNIERGSVTIPGTVDPTSNTAPLIIGRRSPGNNESFPGKVDDVRVFDGALTPADVNVLYEAAN